MDPREDKTPVVFVHGIRISSTMWRPIAHVVGHDRPVAFVDLPGHGPALGRPFTLDAAVAAVEDCIHDVGPPALVVGHSLGGFVGMTLVSRRPELVAGFVGIGCSLKPVRWGVSLYRGFGHWTVRHPERARRLSERIFRLMLPPAEAEAMAAGGLATVAFADAVTHASAVDPVAALKDFPGPVRLVNGALDPFRIGERAVLRACADARLTVLPGRNHISAMAETAVIAHVVRETAAELDRRRAYP